MEQTDYGTDDPLWIDNAYLDTIVTAGLTLFVLCLMKLSKVRKKFFTVCMIFTMILNHSDISHHASLFFTRIKLLLL